MWNMTAESESDTWKKVISCSSEKGTQASAFTTWNFKVKTCNWYDSIIALKKKICFHLFKKMDSEEMISRC